MLTLMLKNSWPPAINHHADGATVMLTLFFVPCSSSQMTPVLCMRQACKLQSALKMHATVYGVEFCIPGICPILEAVNGN